MLLQSGTQYWLLASAAAGETTWYFNSEGVQGSVDIQDYQDAPWRGYTGTQLAFEVLGDAPQAVAPEPGSPILLGLGLLALVLLLRTRTGWPVAPRRVEHAFDHSDNGAGRRVATRDLRA